MPRLSRRVFGFASVSVCVVALAVPGHAAPIASRSVSGPVPRVHIVNHKPATTCIAGCDATGDYGYFDAIATSELTPDGTVDLDGDGSEDVITVDDPGTGVAQIVAHRGSDGLRLLSTSASVVWGIYPMRLGSPARPGLLVVNDASSLTKNLDMGSTLQMSAYDGHSGRLLWRHDYTASYRGVSEPNGVVQLEDILPGKAGRPNEVLLSYRTRPAPNDTGDVVVQPVTVSSVDGRAATNGGALGPVALHSNNPTLASVGDLNGDGATDYGIATAGKFEARSSATGATIWTATMPHLVFTSVPDTDGDGVPDVLLNHTLYDGRTGAVRFTLPGNQQRVAGDADGDGRTDLLDITSSRNDKSLRLRVYSGGTGKPLWTRWFLAPQLTSSSVGDAPIGDIDGDGAQDEMVRSDGDDKADSYHYQEVFVSGRDGAVSTPPGNLGDYARALRASVDGAGDDFWVGKQGQEVQVEDGRSGQVIRSFLASDIGGFEWIEALGTGHFVAGSGLGFLSQALVGSYHGGTNYVRVLDNSGRLLWTASGGYWAI